MNSNYIWSEKDEAYLNNKTNRIVLSTPIEFKQILKHIFDDKTQIESFVKTPKEIDIDINIIRQFNTMLKVYDTTIDNFKPEDCNVYRDENTIVGFKIDGFIIDFEKNLLLDNQDLYLEEHNEIFNDNEMEERSL